MPGDVSEETFVEQNVTYTLEIEGRFIIVEHVPARVSLKTGLLFAWIILNTLSASGE